MTHADHWSVHSGLLLQQLLLQLLQPGPVADAAAPHFAQPAMQPPTGTVEGIIVVENVVVFVAPVAVVV